MKTFTLLIALPLTLLIFTSCSGGSSSSTAPRSTRSQIFSDSSVTAFNQTAGVASINPMFMENVLGKAYAVDGNISCVEGAPVSFSLDALGNTVLVETTCNSNIDLSIRQGLLESMAGKRLLMYYAGGANSIAQNRYLIFNAVGTFWTTYDNINAGGTANCKDQLSFDETTGSVTIENDSVNSLANGAVVQDCLDDEFPGATANDYKKVLKFRFKDGKLEMHSNSTFPYDNDINQFCIDQDGNSVCD